MTRLTLDPIIQRQLSALGEQVALCDETGQTIGYYVPAMVVRERSDFDDSRADMSTEELIRRLKAL